MASRKRILSDAQLDEMCELREAGHGIAFIARHFTRAGTPVSEGSVSWQCLRLGADLPPAHRRPTSNRACVAIRSGHVVRPFTEADDRLLLDMEATGARIGAIARALDRRENSIRGRLYTLARRDARAEEREAA